MWTSPHTVQVQWEGAGCLYKNNTLIACYPRDAAYTLEIGNSPSTDAAYRPQPFDVFTLVRPDGSVEKATLGARPLYLPAFFH